MSTAGHFKFPIVFLFWKLPPPPRAILPGSAYVSEECGNFWHHGGSIYGAGISGPEQRPQGLGAQYLGCTGAGTAVLAQPVVCSKLCFVTFPDLVSFGLVCCAMLHTVMQSSCEGPYCANKGMSLSFAMCDMGRACMQSQPILICSYPFLIHFQPTSWPRCPEASDSMGLLPPRIDEGSR